jgi:hypothetical protein
MRAHGGPRRGRILRLQQGSKRTVELVDDDITGEASCESAAYHWSGEETACSSPRTTAHPEARARESRPR